MVAKSVPYINVLFFYLYIPTRMAFDFKRIMSEEFPQVSESLSAYEKLFGFEKLAFFLSKHLIFGCITRDCKS